MKVRRSISVAAMAVALLFCGSTALAAPVAPAAVEISEPPASAPENTISGPSGEVYQEPDLATMATWAICSPGDGTRDLVRNFNRAAKSGSSLGTTPLYCGPESTKGWGERHIRDKHQGQWEFYSSVAGSPANWRTFTDWAMNQALQYPSTVTTQTSNNTWTYRTQLQIRDSRDVVRGVFYAYVVVDRATANTAKKVITAYPSNK